MDKMVLLYLADGFEEVEALGVVDVLRRAEIDIQTVSITGKREVVSSHGIPVLADLLFSEADHEGAEMLVLPGGMVGTQSLSLHEELGAVLQRAAKELRWVTAICAAPTVLAKYGLLQGKKVICYPGLETRLEGADTSSVENVVMDGKIITSRGPGTTFDFAFALTAALKGQETADKIQAAMLLA